MDFQNYSMENPAFARFGHGVFSGELLLSTLFRWLISLPGLLFNAALLYTIIREKSLRGTCPTLLAIGSSLDIVSLLTFSVTFAVTLSGQNFVTNFKCFFFQLLPNLSIFSSVWIVFFVGFDRFVAVLFPFRVDVLEKKLMLYLSPMLLITIGYSVCVLTMAAQWTLFTYPKWPVLCTNSDAFYFGEMGQMALRNGLIINTASFFCYVAVGLMLTCHWKKMSGSEMNKHRIFKSLSAIMVLVVGSYFAICVVVLLTSQSVTNLLFIFHILPSIDAILTCTAASANAPLLFIFSIDYRIALCKQLKGWPLIGKWINAIGGNNATGMNPIGGNFNVISVIPLESTIYRKCIKN